MRTTWDRSCRCGRPSGTGASLHTKSTFPPRSLHTSGLPWPAMNTLLELAGVALARAFAFYGLVVLAVPCMLFVHALVLGVVVAAVVARHRGRHLWPSVPAGIRR